MGYHVCYTDHSLFGFADIASININKALSTTLSDIDHAICVSNTCRENLVLRASIHPSLVSTIPNAVDVTKFTPDPSRRAPTNTINVVLLSRLVYRKGIDLLVRVIPRVCAKVTNVHFVVGGDGPKRLLLEEMRERFQLHDRVELLGAVAHHQVHGVLTRGHIFLNCSLTESFCIALLEAASCGLFVVSTKVGGVPEVLPPSMVKFAEPSVDSLVDSLIEAISVSRRVVPTDFHERVRSMYSWLDVAKRTELVYASIAATKRPSLGVRLARYATLGTFSGAGACFLVAALHLLWRACQWLWPDQAVELCPAIALGSSTGVASSGGDGRSSPRHRKRGGASARSAGRELGSNHRRHGGLGKLNTDGGGEHVGGSEPNRTESSGTKTVHVLPASADTSCDASPL